jgi:hypothetical protein
LRYREFLLQTLPAARERREEERKHLLDLAATYQRPANAIAPQPPAEPSNFPPQQVKRTPTLGRRNRL